MKLVNRLTGARFFELEEICKGYMCLHDPTCAGLEIEMWNWRAGSVRLMASSFWLHVNTV